MAGNKNRNWARVAVALCEDDTLYLIGVVSSDIGAMASNQGKWSIPMQRARRIRQKLQDALRSSNATSLRQKKETV